MLYSAMILRASSRACESLRAIFYMGITCTPTLSYNVHVYYTFLSKHMHACTHYCMNTCSPCPDTGGGPCPNNRGGCDMMPRPALCPCVCPACVPVGGGGGRCMDETG